jgi:hypothetical protein
MYVVMEKEEVKFELAYFVAEQRDCLHDCLLRENPLFQALGYLLVNLQEICLQFEA